MNTSIKIKIDGGHKNETFKVIEGNNVYFLKKKKYDKFNHKVNYKEISKLNFVPTLIYENKDSNLWAYIEPEKLTFNEQDLRDMAKILHDLHNSNLSLPPSNHKARLETYYNDLKAKKNKPKEVELFKDIVMNIIEEFDATTPLHNDPWMNNFIRSGDKMYLIDWEFASLGDKHFDLAFAIDGSYLTSDQEKIFLKYYGKYSKDKLYKAKILVNYLTLIWMHRYDKLPFSDEPIIKNLYANINKQ